MEFSIMILESTMKQLEMDMRGDDLMHKNRAQATLHMKNISELKRAIKLLKAKSRSLN